MFVYLIICIFKLIYIYSYINCVHPKLSSRNLFLKTVINETTVAISKSDLKYLSFLCNLLYSIKYSVEEEPLYIISLIDSEISLNSTKSYYQLSQVFSIEEKEEIEEKESLENIIHYSLESCRFISLLLLRSYLKSDYHLQAEKIVNFNMFSQTKAKETSISNEYKKRENNIKEFTLPSSLDDCKAIYMEFDSMMENYGIDGDENQSKRVKKRKSSSLPAPKPKKVKKSTSKAYEKDSDYSEC